MTTEIQEAVLDAAHEGKCACGRPLVWTLPDEFHTSYGTCTGPCSLEIAQHTISGRMEVEQL